MSDKERLSPDYWTPEGARPRLFLAPMEGLGDRFFRQAMSELGGFDEACSEFIRVPKNAHVASLARVYNSIETAPIPIAAQIMGEDLDHVAAMTIELVNRGAPRIDLNCGCPSNTVTGRGAGSSLLRTPERLHDIVKAIVNVSTVPVTAKLRSGFEDTSLLDENLLAAQDAGVAFITLHPRTKKEGYAPPARWDLIARAKEILSVPVVGNGDIICVDSALEMLKQTGCDALMIGRGAAQNPWIFHEIRAHFASEPSPRNAQGVITFIRRFQSLITDVMPVKTQVNKLKQLVNFLFGSCPDKRKELLRMRCSDPSDLADVMVLELSGETR